MRPFHRTAATAWITGVSAIVIGTGGLGPTLAVAEEPLAASTRAAGPVTTAAIGRWIDELGHDAFTVRQAAASRLLTAGLPARGPLLAMIDAPDPETRAAARRLVAQIDRTEFHRRLEAFAADIDGRRGLTLPGWEPYRDLVGGDPTARALFVEMQRHEAPLLSAVFGETVQPPDQLWEERVLRLVQWQATAGNRGSTPPLGSCAAMLYLASVSEMDISDRGAMLVEGLIQRPPIRETLQAAAPQDALRRLVVAWVLQCPNTNEHILLRRLNLISTIDLKEALPLVLDVAGGDPQYARAQPLVRAMAVLAVGQLGGPEHVAHLEPLLEDASVCLSGQARMPGQPAVPGQLPANIEVRDVALVVMLHLTGQRPADYGYLHARLQPGRTFQLQTLHRGNDQQRVEAIAKWQAWRAAHQDAGGLGQ